LQHIPKNFSAFRLPTAMPFSEWRMSHDQYLMRHTQKGRTRWHSWLSHCATNRKIAGSIPDGVTGIFQWLNPSGRIVALGSTQPLTEMSTRNRSLGVKTAGA
jgi:hypothetical protein